ncbi:MAG TPA: alpha/beta fold hydrolase [Thermoanaerobaculia bacterium]|nr:alpha/beta fold hydrolase [Thermoanaerobaculia bacterium]
MALAGHLWTVASRFWPVPEPPEARPWRTQVIDPQVGEVPLTGLLRAEPGSTDLLIFVHGIGGCAEASYAKKVAGMAFAMGLSCLRINLRGSDRASNDFYHAGLSSDLAQVVASPDLAGFERIYCLGYSLGGHLALRYACETPDPRVQGVAAVCSPLDLAPAAAVIDRPASWPYRRYVLRNLLTIYRSVAERRPVPLPVEEAERFTLIRHWDDLVVSPRWGFIGASDYHARASVAPLLPHLAVPALLVAVDDDPMVPGEVVRPVVARRFEGLDVRWVDRGGHVGFPRDLDLGEDAPLGIEGQALGWLLRAG